MVSLTKQSNIKAFLELFISVFRLTCELILGAHVLGLSNLVPRACDSWEGNEGSGIIRCRKPGILAKIELRIHFNGQSDSSLKRIIPEPSFPSQGSQARGTRLWDYPVITHRTLEQYIPQINKQNSRRAK